MKKMNFKKSLKILIIFCITVGAISCNNKKDQLDNNTPTPNEIFSKGEKVTNTNFTGNVWLNNLAQADSINQNAVGSVTFEPGARTKWHSHPAGQIILALEGVGYYQEKGSPKIIVNKGDVIKCPADIQHWHGASKDTKFVQVAITGREKGETIWLEKVSDTEYSK
ncbi:cupin domain-containing protein [Flavobacterium piscisymbiosum]|uniref:Cupin domain-containing protein n=1 Tax=Flavobacterium piscisymbiosum TaxID=2893753 RepID=A0ABS8MJP8_9FLAO|nr:cupin domain-containing protein [Flavobacterium sp. F-30]MCC9064910.1 cupin domain-containing protein [Flavobacterium sp. F-30]